MLISDVFPDGRSLMFFNALIQVSACVGDISASHRSHLKWYTTHFWFPRGGLFSFGLMLDLIFRLVYTGWISFPIFRLSSPSCLRTELGYLWSLNGNIILTGAYRHVSGWMLHPLKLLQQQNLWWLIAGVGLGNEVERKSPWDVHIPGGIVASSKKA